MSAKKTISAKEMLADIKVGLTDDQLMNKYRLSVSGLQSLFVKLTKAGLLTQAQLDQRSQPIELNVDQATLETGEIAPKSDTANSILPPSSIPSKDETNKTSWSHDDKALASCLLAGLATGICMAQWATKSWFWFIIWVPIFAVVAFFGYFAFLDKFKEKIKHVTIAGIIFVLMVIGNSGKSPSTEPGTQSERNQTTQDQAASPKTEKKADTKQASGISFEDIRSKFITKGGELTDAQKDKEWSNNYKGKRVRWSGRITDVKEGWTGSITVTIDKGYSPITHMDIRIDVQPKFKDKAMQLKKGQSVEFAGKLDMQPGPVMSYVHLQEGEILE